MYITLKYNIRSLSLPILFFLLRAQPPPTKALLSPTTTFYFLALEKNKRSKSPQLPFSISR